MNREEVKKRLSNAIGLLNQEMVGHALHASFYMVKTCTNDEFDAIEKRLKDTYSYLKEIQDAQQARILSRYFNEVLLGTVHILKALGQLHSRDFDLDSVQLIKGLPPRGSDSLGVRLLRELLEVAQPELVSVSTLMSASEGNNASRIDTVGRLRALVLRNTSRFIVSNFGNPIEESYVPYVKANLEKMRADLEMVFTRVPIVLAIAERTRWIHALMEYVQEEVKASARARPSTQQLEACLEFVNNTLRILSNRHHIAASIEKLDLGVVAGGVREPETSVLYLQRLHNIIIISSLEALSNHKRCYPSLRKNINMLLDLSGKQGVLATEYLNQAGRNLIYGFQVPLIIKLQALLGRCSPQQRGRDFPSGEVLELLSEVQTLSSKAVAHQDTIPEKQRATKSSANLGTLIYSYVHSNAPMSEQLPLAKALHSFQRFFSKILGEVHCIDPLIRELKDIINSIETEQACGVVPSSTFQSYQYPISDFYRTVDRSLEVTLTADVCHYINNIIKIRGYGGVRRASDNPTLWIADMACVLLWNTLLLSKRNISPLGVWDLLSPSSSDASIKTLGEVRERMVQCMLMGSSKLDKRKGSARGTANRGTGIEAVGPSSADSAPTSASVVARTDTGINVSSAFPGHSTQQSPNCLIITESLSASSAAGSCASVENTRSFVSSRHSDDLHSPYDLVIDESPLPADFGSNRTFERTDPRVGSTSSVSPRHSDQQSPLDLMNGSLPASGAGGAYVAARIDARVDHISFVSPRHSTQHNLLNLTMNGPLTASGGGSSHVAAGTGTKVESTNFVSTTHPYQHGATPYPNLLELALLTRSLDSTHLARPATTTVDHAGFAPLSNHPQHSTYNSSAAASRLYTATASGSACVAGPDTRMSHPSFASYGIQYQQHSTHNSSAAASRLYTATASGSACVAGPDTRMSHPSFAPYPTNPRRYRQRSIDNSAAASGPYTATDFGSTYVAGPDTRVSHPSFAPYPTNPRRYRQRSIDNSAAASRLYTGTASGSACVAGPDTRVEGTSIASLRHISQQDPHFIVEQSRLQLSVTQMSASDDNTRPDTRVESSSIVATHPSWTIRASETAFL